jgi:6-phosphogluconolactonase
VANAFSNAVSAYRIGVNGTLTPVARSPFSAGIEPESVAVDRLGRFVYTANNGNGSNGSVSAYSISVNGALRPVPGSPFTGGFTNQSEPSSVAVDPWGRFVYVTNYGTYLLSAYRIGAGGALTPVPGSPFTTGVLPTAVTVDLSGRFVYVANSYIANSVSAYSIGANGALTPVPGAPFPAGDEPHSVAVAP